MVKKWNPSEISFPVVYLDFYFWQDSYTKDKAGGSLDVLIKTNIPDLVKTYGTEAVYLPLAPAVVAALNSSGAVEALNGCGLVERVLVQQPTSNLLYMASLMCDKICNENCKETSLKKPIQELETCIGGRDKRWKWVVLQKEGSKWGVDLKFGVPNPKVMEREQA